jgi:hypothetical protein
MEQRRITTQPMENYWLSFMLSKFGDVTRKVQPLKYLQITIRCVIFQLSPYCLDDKLAGLNFFNNSDLGGSISQGKTIRLTVSVDFVCLLLHLLLQGVNIMFGSIRN